MKRKSFTTKDLLKPNIEISTDRTMQRIAKNVHEECGPKYGFMVLVFPFDKDEKVAHYVSNANRKDMIQVLREKADIFEKGYDIENQIEVQ
jgi:hypothetical protein